MTITLFALWMLCAALSYLVARSDTRRDGLKWTTGSRWFFLIGSFLFGPAALLASLVLWLLGAANKDSKEARW